MLKQFVLLLSQVLQFYCWLFLDPFHDTYVRYIGYTALIELPSEASVSAGMLFVQGTCCWWRHQAVTVTCCGACRVTHTHSIRTSWRCRLWCLLKVSCGRWLRFKVVMWRLSCPVSAFRNLESQTLPWLLDNTWNPQGSTSYWRSRFVLGSVANKCRVMSSPACATLHRAQSIIYLRLFLSIQHVTNRFREFAFSDICTRHLFAI